MIFVEIFHDLGWFLLPGSGWPKWNGYETRLFMMRSLFKDFKKIYICIFLWNHRYYALSEHDRKHLKIDKIVFDSNRLDKSIRIEYTMIVSYQHYHNIMCVCCTPEEIVDYSNVFQSATRARRFLIPDFEAFRKAVACKEERSSRKKNL